MSIFGNNGRNSERITERCRTNFQKSTRICSETIAWRYHSGEIFEIIHELWLCDNNIPFLHSVAQFVKIFPLLYETITTSYRLFHHFSQNTLSSSNMLPSASAPFHYQRALPNDTIRGPIGTNLVPNLLQCTRSHQSLSTIPTPRAHKRIVAFPPRCLHLVRCSVHRSPCKRRPTEKTIDCSSTTVYQGGHP